MKKISDEGEINWSYHSHELNASVVDLNISAAENILFEIINEIKMLVLNPGAGIIDVKLKFVYLDGSKIGFGFDNVRDDDYMHYTVDVDIDGNVIGIYGSD